MLKPPESTFGGFKEIASPKEELQRVSEMPKREMP
jgi:hypothetical protein